MNGTMIASTSRGNMHPLAYQGIFATDCHHQIASVLRSRLGDAHVLLFAEPAPDSGRDVIDWYSPVQGTPVRLIDLPAEKQGQVRATLIKMAADIAIQVRRLIDTGDSNRVLAGRLLELALQYPSDDCIFMVGEQPVLVCWGFGPPTSGAKPQELGRLATLSPRPERTVPPPTPEPRLRTPGGESAPEPDSAPPPATPAVVPVSPRPASGHLLRWLLVLLGLGVLALLLWLLFTYVGTGAGGGELGFNPTATATATDSEPATAAATRNAALRQERDALLAALVVKAAQCPQPAAPDASRELRLPGDARAGSSLAFLQGVWRCDSDLSTTKDPVIVDYLFDGEGKGRLTIKTDQRICTAGAQASMDAAGQLLIESDAVIPCSTGGPIDGQRVECARNGAATICQGVNMTSKGVWKARFLKF